MSYLEENRGYITASKLKDFMKSPEIYYLKYIKEMQLEKPKTCFKIWTALDDYFSYWQKVFSEKYFIDEMLDKTQLQEILTERWVEFKKTDLKADLMDLVYWDWQSKVRLTKTEAETINKMIAELERQPLFNVKGKYTPQVELKVKYDWLNFKWTLDRVFFEDKVFRDYKTTSDIKWLERELRKEADNVWSDNLTEYWFNTIWWGYLFSMAFYQLLLTIEHKEKFEAILDIVSTNWWNASNMIKLDNNLLWEVVKKLIMPAIHDLVARHKEFTKTGDESIWQVTRDRSSLYGSEYFWHMESTKQKEFTTLF